MIDPTQTEAPVQPGPEPREHSRRMMSRVMHALGRLMREDSSGENPKAVQMFNRMSALREAFSGSTLRRAVDRARGVRTWPVSAGSYVVSDLAGCVAVCVLTSGELMEPLARLPGVAIAGRVYTPNLGIEKVIRNISANPNIRYLLVCGRESPVFRVGQAFQYLFQKGVDAHRRIIDAEGHYPVLQNLSAKETQDFLKQVELVPRIGVTDVAEIQELVQATAHCNPGPYVLSLRGPMPVLEAGTVDEETDSLFMAIRPGGHREPLVYDPKGFFIISLDRVREEIVVRHYHPDHTPAYIIRGRTAEPILLGLLREGLISQLSHAGYLGVELTKAELALKMNRPYEQDKPVNQFLK